jgi:hypothetical protein
VLCTLRLDPRFRWALYAALTVLVVSGAAWLVADQLKDTAELWQETAANLLMVHGGTAMVTLMLLGALFPAHVGLNWRGMRSRITGTALIAINAVLIVTAFALYYLGSESARPWISDIHTLIGFLLPVVVIVHVVLGRRWRSIIQKEWD